VKTGSGSAAVVHTTAHHPFWSAQRHEWVDAMGLTPQEKLAAPVPLAASSVSEVHPFIGAEAMYNLTVANLHTYYVLAGKTPVLVHNCGGTVGTTSGAFCLRFRARVDCRSPSR
jgi:hypothetical protein